MKHAVISGGSSGIGKALARQLLTDGWSVSLLARTRATLDQAKADLAAFVTLPAQTVNIYSVDVADYDALTKVIAETVAVGGPPNMLIASAGIAHPGYFRNVPLDTHYQTMSTNYFGTLHLVKAALPYMEANKGGDVVLISSGAGLVGIFGYSPYSPSKFAVRGLAESLRRELKDSGIQTFVVYPPDTDTPQLIEERKTKPVETSRITESAKMFSADAVARSILAGVRKGRFVIAPGWEMFLLSALHSLINPILQWHFDGLVTAVRKPKVLQQNSTSIQTQLARFLIVGVAVVLFDMALFAVLSIVLRVNYLAANTLSFLLSMSLEYFISREWVFNKTEHQAAKDFTKFLIAGAACVAVANGILFVCMRYRLSDIVAVGLDYGTQLILAKVMSIVAVAGFDFWLKKAFVFKLN